jgi:hypothetical protein
VHPTFISRYPSQAPTMLYSSHSSTSHIREFGSEVFTDDFCGASGFPPAVSTDLPSFQTCEHTQTQFQTTPIFRFSPDYHPARTIEQELPSTPFDFCSKPNGRAILTDEQAQQIFRCKPAPEEKVRKRAAALSKIYGVSAKAIRDIWLGRSWYRATCHLDQSKPPTAERLQKKAGRPKGARDSKPRAKKYPNDIVDSAVSSVEPTADVASVACVPDTRLPIGRDFPGDLSTRPFPNPFDDDWDGGLWEQGRADPAPIFDPFDGLAFGELNHSAAGLW